MKAPHNTLKVIRELQEENRKLRDNIQQILLLVEKFEKESGERLSDIINKGDNDHE